MDNVITIRLKETATGEHDYHIDFESSPSLPELCAAELVLNEVLENNFDRELIFKTKYLIYGRIRDIEEVKRRS